LTLVSWTAPALAEEVDRRVVVNPAQAAALLGAVGDLAPELEAFFGCMYYAALRPEEALNLQDVEYERPSRPGGWGWLHLTGATVMVAGGWVDDETSIERRGLKHRPTKATRDVAVPPPLVELLDRHLGQFPPVNGRLFVNRRGPGGRYVASTGQPVRASAYGKVWRLARERALTPAQVQSLLAHVPYALRHAAVSLWLNAGVPATRVADWAGHSVQVLLRIYAKCIDGQDEAARHRIEGALLVPVAEPGGESDGG
jgi:integrase